MRIKDIFLLTIKNITYRKLRSWLTVLGIIIGIAAVVGLMGLGDAIHAAITSQLGSLGADKMIITPGESQRAFRRSFGSGGEIGSVEAEIIGEAGDAKITEREAQQVSKLPNVLAVSPMVQESYEVKLRGEFATLTVQFVEPIGMNLVEEPEILSGRWLTPSDKLSCVIGYDVANDVFSDEVRVGDMIKVNEQNCRIVGILEEVGGFSSTDSYIIINIDSIESYNPEYDDELTYIYVRVTDSEKVYETEDDISKLLKKLHNTLEEDFTILTFASIQETVQTILDLDSAFIGGIAAISLLVGAIGISNTMFTSVMERTREIGILRAIGAKGSDIKWLIITEASIMSLLGGIVGIITGIGLAYAIIFGLPLLFPFPSSIELRFVFNMGIIVASLFISVVIGVLSGYFPARKAAKLDPIRAIWYE